MSSTKGYRQLSVKDIDKMNQLKELEEKFLRILDEEKNLNEVTDSPRKAEAIRALDIARQHINEATMWACRSIAQPQRLTDV